jgi:hypothetical protein
MNSGFSPKSIVVVFVIVLAFYLGGFWGLEYLRTHKGPWEVRFDGNSSGVPSITVRQATVGVQDVKLIFHGESTNGIGVVRFDGVQKDALFGEVIYEDLTFLPGVVTFNLFGHEIELLPRVLVVNKKEIPWQSGSEINLWPTNKLPVPPKPLPGNRPVAAH